MLKRFLSSMTMVVAGVGCAFFTHLVLAKTLSAEEYGVFSFIFSLSLLIGVFSLFGFQNSSVKTISIFQTEDLAKNQTRQFIRFAYLFTVSLSVFSALIFYGVLYFLGLAEKYSQEALLIGVFLTPLMVFMRLNAAFLRGFSKSTLSVIYETTLREVLFLGLILAAIFFSLQFSTGTNALSMLFLALFIASLVSWIHAFVYYRKQPQSVITNPKELKKEWVKLSLPMMFIIFAQRLLRRFDIIILGLMVNPALVGAYAIAAQFSEVGSIGQKGVFAVFAPKAAQLHKEKKADDLKIFYRKMQWIGIFCMAVIGIAILIFAPTLLQFFGEGYAAAYIALAILIAGQFLNICFGPVGMLMIMVGREKKAMQLTMMAAIGNLVCNPPAIYFYGLEGAAAVTVFFLVLRAFLSYIDIKKQKIL